MFKRKNYKIKLSKLLLSHNGKSLNAYIASTVLLTVLLFL